VNTDELLAERQKTHGDFQDVAYIANHLKYFYRSLKGWSRLNAVQQEVFDADACKRARILAGDPNYSDHIIDIIGYAELYVRELNRK
jgi:hypothetical protein